MLTTAAEAEVNLKVMFSGGLFHVDKPVLADKQELRFISSVWTLDAV